MMTAEKLPPTTCDTVKPSTFAAMERWARWRAGGGSGAMSASVGGGVVSGIFKRLQNAKRSQTCPNCNGAKRVPVPGTKSTAPCWRCGAKGKITNDLVTVSRRYPVRCGACKTLVDGRYVSMGEINGATCRRCRGSGVAFETVHTVHPATIKGTRLYGLVAPHGRGSSARDDAAVCGLISHLVLQWRGHDATFWWHYVVLEEYQPGDIRTREQKATEMGLSPQYFSRMLKCALLAIQARLEMLE